MDGDIIYIWKKKKKTSETWVCYIVKDRPWKNSFIPFLKYTSVEEPVWMNHAEMGSCSRSGETGWASGRFSAACTVQWGNGNSKGVALCMATPFIWSLGLHPFLPDKPTKRVFSPPENTITLYFEAVRNQRCCNNLNIWFPVSSLLLKQSFPFWHKVWSRNTKKYL